ncbi:hypothetical protein [Alteromonas lipotrueiana]|uniref:hypothetical protein n=1 Tax=Alteromonas lipotrueiana TaxID=2803815 RepID=UPI001C45CB2A|nr:hypothetical protein [Alteromonas lipotrueiana]
MKSWIYLLLLGFAAIAAYKFGYYQEQLADSDEDKQRIMARLDHKPALLATTLESSIAPQGESFISSAPDFEDMFDSESASRIKDFFTLHPRAGELLLHSVKCSLKSCELTGEFRGTAADLNLMVEQLEHQDWWRYGKAIQNSTLQGDTHHFTLRYRPDITS